MHATIPKGNMGYGQYTISNDCSCRTYFCCFPLALANICPWPLVPFFQISLENRADKTTHNTFWDCRVHFFRQPFSKQLYIYIYIYIACFVISHSSGDFNDNNIHNHRLHTLRLHCWGKFKCLNVT